MTKKEFIIVLLLIVICFFGGYFTRKAFEPKYDFKRDTTTYVDTIPYYKPIPKDSMVLRYITKTISKKHTDYKDSIIYDSIDVDIPISQKYYESKDYKAWVSGYEPSLDSIKVYQKTIEIKETITKTPSRWNIGVFGGYGYGFSSKRFEPVIGVGIGYRIW